MFCDLKPLVVRTIICIGLRKISCFSIESGSRRTVVYNIHAARRVCRYRNTDGSSVVRFMVSSVPADGVPARPADAAAPPVGRVFQRGRPVPHVPDPRGGVLHGGAAVRGLAARHPARGGVRPARPLRRHLHHGAHHDLRQRHLPALRGRAALTAGA